MTDPFHDWDPYDYLNEINSRCQQMLEANKHLINRVEALDGLFHEMAVHIVHLEAQIEELEKTR